MKVPKSFSIILTLWTLAHSTHSTNPLLPQALSEFELDIFEAVRRIVQTITDTKFTFLFTSDVEIAGELIQALGEKSVEVWNLDGNISAAVAATDAHFKILLTDSSALVNLYLGIAYTALNYKYNKKYLIVYVGDEDVDLIFNTLWKMFQMKTLVMDKHSDFYRVGTYREFCTGTKIKRFLFNLNDFNLTAISRFYNSETSKLQGCNFRVSPMVNPPYVTEAGSGIEFNIFKAFAEVQQISYSVVKPAGRYGRRLPNGTYTNHFLDLYERKVDVVFGMVMMDPYYYVDFTPSFPVIECALSFFVPKARVVHSWRNVVIMYSVEVWYAIAAAITFVVLFVWFAKKVTESKEFDFALIYICMMFINRVVRQPNTRLFKTIFLTWAVFSYLMISVYECKLMSSLTYPFYEKQVTTMRDVLQSRLEVRGLPSYQNIVDARINFKPGWPADSLDNLTRRNLIVLDDGRSFDYTMNDTNRVQIFKTPVVLKFFTYFVMLKGMPLENILNRFVLKLREAGFIARIVKRYDVVFKEKGEPTTTVSMDEIQFMFYGYLIGVGAAGLVFVWECRLGIFGFIKAIVRI